jgi:RNA polymerase sigma factor (TIGR02999 family)
VIEELLPLVYAELRQSAAGYLRRERPGHTLQPMALVHEAYIRMVRNVQDGIAERPHFMAIAAIAMRRILVDHARARGAEKRGGNNERETMSGIGEDADHVIDVLDLESSLTKLAKLHERPARAWLERALSQDPAA